MLIIIGTLIIVLTLLRECNMCFNGISSTYLEEDYIRLSHFLKLNELKFNCSKPAKLSILEFKPSEKLTLTNDLNTTGLKIQSIYGSISITFFNFKGFDLLANPFTNRNFINFNTENIQWNICNSNIGFFLDEKPLKCSRDLINQKWFSNMFMQSNLLFIQCSKLSKLCPIIFRNSYLIVFKIDRISNSLLSKNALSFDQLEVDDLNSTIVQFETKLYHFNLSSSLLHENVFKNLLVLDISGQIDSIEDELFKKLWNLKLIRFSTEKMRNLFSRNNNWMKYLNPYAAKSKNFEDQLLFLIFYQPFQNYSIYTYPDEDFCLFQTFPHNRYVLPKLKPNFKTSCSCTELFLIHNSYKHSSHINYYAENILDTYYYAQYYSSVIDDNGIFSHCVNDSIEEFISDCHFFRRLSSCNVSTQTNKEFNFYLNDWYDLSSNTQFLFSVYLNPILSLVIMVMNIIIIVILNEIKSAQNCVRMYQHLKTNTYFHLFYLMTQSFKLIMDCKFVDLFCSSIYDSFYAQVFNVYVVKFLGNAFRTASNVSHISFTLSRYAIVVSNNDSILAKFNRMNFKVYLVIVFIFSLIINLNICFEYTFETTIAYFKIPTKFKNLYYKKQTPVDDFVEDFAELSVLSIVRYIKIIFSDLFYIIISFTLDMVLLKYVKTKRKTVRSCKADTKKNEHFSMRLTGMIILNGINFSIFRLPSSILSLYGFFFRFDARSFEYKPSVVGYIVCRLFMFCSCLNEYFYFIYLNSFIVQFFILTYLDKNFKKSFERLQSTLSKRFERFYLS